jgi:hypothetical protein
MHSVSPSFLILRTARELEEDIVIVALSSPFLDFVCDPC